LAQGPPPCRFLPHSSAPSAQLDDCRALNAALTAAGAASELVEVPGGGHGGPAFTDQAILDHAARLLDAAFAGRTEGRPATSAGLVPAGGGR
jgi:hypothetical protein